MTNRSQLDTEVPADIACERTLLGAVLKNNDAWDEVSKLKPDDWHLDSHRRIRMAMKRLKDSGSAIEELTLCDVLRSRGELETVGGMSYILDLMEGVYRNIAIEDHLRIVRDKGVLRKLMGTCADVIRRAGEQSETGLELTAGLMSDLEALSAGRKQDKKARLSEFLVDAFEEINREYAARISPCIPSGNAWFDSKTGGGYRQSNITLICARPNVGKTPWAVMSLAHNLKLGRKCVMFSLEKKKESILRDLIPYVVELPNRVANNPWMQTPEQNRLVGEAMNQLAEWGDLLIVHDEKMTRDDICWVIKTQSKGGQKVLFELDHFGMIAPTPGEKLDSNERDNMNSAALRDTIKNTESAIVVLRQLRKVSREFADKEPVPDDVKGSANAWEDAFAALIIHRGINAETKKMSQKASLNLAKLRTGGSGGSTTAEFNTKRLEFVAWAELEYGSFYE